MSDKRLKIVMIAHYYPPINSSGAKRFQYLSKYLVDLGVDVTVITTKKSSSDGEFTEALPDGVNVYEFDSWGRQSKSTHNGEQFVPLYSDKPSFIRRIKDFVMVLFGQIPDPRLPFAFSFLFRSLPSEVRDRIKLSDFILATSPPWSILLAGFFLKFKFNKKLVLDYRDNFSHCHEMPGNSVAKKVEYIIDKWLAKKADALVTISEPMKTYYSSFNDKTYIVNNGYDFESMELARQYNQKRFKESNEKKHVIIRYMGIVSDGRIPRNFIKALHKLDKKENDLALRIQLEFYGNGSLLKTFLKNNYPNLERYFSFYDFVSYDESLKLMVEADYLLFSETSDVSNLSSQGILTTKLFEYLGSGRPIIADISDTTLAGGLIATSSERNIVTISTERFYQFLSNPEFYSSKESDISKTALLYTRKNQAKLYKEILERLL
jgi:glycosyltransferase involved in cell wall biosynthesis